MNFQTKEMLFDKWSNLFNLDNQNFIYKKLSNTKNTQ